MASVAYVATIKTCGVAVPVTAEACSFISGTDPTKLYQVTAAARRTWDPTAAIVVKDGGTPVAAANFSFNYLNGTITFIGHSASGSITLDGSYLPKVAIAEACKFSFQCMVDLLDKSNFDTGQARSKLAALVDFAGSVELYSQIDAVLFGSTTLATLLAAGTPMVLEVGFDGGTNFFRCWIQQDSATVETQTEALVSNMISWKGSAQGAGASFSLGI